MKKISVVVAAFNEEKNIPILYFELINFFKETKLQYEIIFIDDASDDTTQTVIKGLLKSNIVKGYSLKKNSKKAGALELGFQKAQGDIVITLDADLQDDPKEMKNLIKEIDNGADVVVGWRKERIDSLTKIIPSFAINNMANFFLGMKFHDMNTGFKAYRKNVINNISFHGSLFRFIPHLLAAEGFDIREMPIKHRKRKFGKTKFSWRHRLRSLFDLVTVIFISKFKDSPLHFFGVFGMLFFLLGCGINVYLSIRWFQGYGIGDRPILFLGMLLMIVGIQIASIGLIGELILYLRPKDKITQNYVEIRSE